MIYPILSLIKYIYYKFIIYNKFKKKIDVINSRIFILICQYKKDPIQRWQEHKPQLNYPPRLTI